MIRTRMAPSPTGEFHIGGMRTLLYNYAFAKKNGGQFVLRIEDTDRARLVPGALDRILQVIKDYGLSWDEGPEIQGLYKPYVQSDRLSIYKEHVEKLLETKNAYYCFCSKERLDTLRDDQRKQGLPTTKYDKHCLSLSDEEVKKSLSENKPFVIRLNVHPNEFVTYEDMFLGDVTVNSSEIDDQVLLKSDGFPTYHLAVVVDDYLMKITHIMRGVEWLPSTPKHILLYKAFGWELPKIGHLPVLKEVGSTKKLSKRDGSVHANEFLAEGFLPEALLNFLMFLGWNPGTEKELYSLDEFLNDFTLERVHKSDMVSFDREKLLWYNGHYIRSLSSKDLLQKICVWADKFSVTLPKEFLSDSTYKVLDIIKERLKKFSEISDLIGYFYAKPNVLVSDLISHTSSSERSKNILNDFLNLYKAQNVWEVENLDQISHELITSKGYKPKEAFMTVRLAVSGTKATPPLFDTLFCIGQENVVGRLEDALKLIDTRN